jgi:Subtilase family
MTKRLSGGTIFGCLPAVFFFGCAASAKGPAAPPSVNKPYELPDLDESVWRPLVKTFEKQARGIPDDQQKSVFAKSFAAAKTPVSVAIVDFVPDATAPRHQFVHNESVSQVIRNLSCNDPNRSDCAERVYVYPRPPGEIRKAERGNPESRDSMSLEDLTQAISAILGRAHPETARLVINVAVGLDPIKLTQGDLSIDPLIKVLKRASCLGVIVIAAAGNVTGTEGPLIPAALETMPAATAAECDALGLPRSPRTKAQYAPLVYAVGGLDPLDQRLSIGRRWGQPRLAAFGMSVSAPVPGSKPYSFPLSGTSMSAAIVAGVAAAVWTAKPDLDAHQVMAHVYQGGVPLDGGLKSKRAQTEFCLGNPLGPCHDPVHRVFLCGALESALGGHFGCDKNPSTSYEAPRWPQSKEAPTGPAPVPCKVTGCRHELGAMGSQLPDGAVSQPYISGCPGCGIDQVLARLSGQLTWYSNPQRLTSVIATSYALGRVVIGHDYSMQPWAPTSKFSLPFSAASNLLYTVLEVTFMDDENRLQTDYQTVLPVSP